MEGILARTIRQLCHSQQAKHGLLEQKRWGLISRLCQNLNGKLTALKYQKKSKSFLTDSYINYILESYLKNFQGLVSVSLMEKVKHKKEKQLVDKKAFKDFLENQISVVSNFGK